jgi:hypothetical protein
MRISKNHKKILNKHKEKFEGKQVNGALTYFNDKYKDIIQENIKLYEFESLFTNIMVLLNDEKIAEIPEIDMIKYFFENEENIKKNNKEYTDYKTLKNGLFGRLPKYENGILIQSLIVKYQNLIMSEILENNDKILYIDTDIIYSNEIINIDQITQIPYSIKSIPSFLPKKIKRYLIEEEDGSIILKGYFDPISRQNIMNEFKQMKRNINLSKLGIN